MASSLTPYKFPAPLKPGDRLICIAPSGALKSTNAFEKGVDIWRSRGYQVENGLHWNAQEGYLAGTDQQRRQALTSAWKDPDCKGILCIRGGYGSARLLEQGDWQTIFQNPKWLIGFFRYYGPTMALSLVRIGGNPWPCFNHH